MNKGAGSSSRSRTGSVRRRARAPCSPRGHLDAVSHGQLSAGLEVEDVAGVVLHQVQYSGSAVDRPCRSLDLVGGRRGEDRTWTGRAQHPVTHEPAVQRFVPATTAGQYGLPLTAPPRLVMKSGSRCTSSRSGCARVIPVSASATTSAGSLMIFFTPNRPSLDRDAPHRANRALIRLRRQPDSLRWSQSRERADLRARRTLG